MFTIINTNDDRQAKDNYLNNRDKKQFCIYVTFNFNFNYNFQRKNTCIKIKIVCFTVAIRRGNNGNKRIAECNSDQSQADFAAPTASLC